MGLIHVSTDINEKLKDYLNQSVNDTDAEMLATASLFGIDIVLHSKVADCMEWLRYPASFSNERTSDFAIYLKNISDHLNFNLVIGIQ